MTSKALYRDGYINLSLKPGKSLDRLHNVISEMNSKNIKNNFYWETKYQNTEDFRPTVFEYDQIFVDILIENNIHKIINKAAQKQLLLAHIQLRRVFPGPSYMNWHRDTHFKSGDTVSVSPPAHKIIFFPGEFESNVECLKIAKSSHLCMNPSQKEEDFINPGFSSFDNQILNSEMLEIDSLSESKSNALFFDTSCLHAALPSVRQSGSTRLVYLFMSEDPFNERYAAMPHHFNLNKLYQEKILKNE